MRRGLRLLDEALDGADVVLLGVREHPEPRAVEPQCLDGFLREQRVGAEATLLDDVVLEQPMDGDDVAAGKVLPTTDGLADGLPGVDDELQVELRDEDARVALATRRLGDIAEAAAEGEVAGIDGVEELRTTHRGRRCEDEARIAFDGDQGERGRQAADHGLDQVGQDVLGVIELGAGEVARVAGDVGDQQDDGFGGAEHFPLTLGEADGRGKVGRSVDVPE